MASRYSVKHSLLPHISLPSGFVAGLGYLLVGLVIAYGWSVRDLRLIISSEGLGYGLGVAGSIMMVLLLLYPLRKRSRLLRNAGPIAYWFRVHMILGVVGPLLVLLHSNFSLGSINSKVALFCTVVVATSGILGRYLYAKIHNGLYGQRLTFEAIRAEIEVSRSTTSALNSIVLLINAALRDIEDRVAEAGDRIGTALHLGVATTLRIALLRLQLRRQCRREIRSLASRSDVVEANQKRLLVSTYRYLDYRLSVLRKFAQLRAGERLFSLWHVVHYPLFMVLVVAAVVHVVAVHMY